MKIYVESYRRTIRDFLGQDRFLGIETLWKTLHARHTKEGLHRQKFSRFFSKIFLKLHFKGAFNPYMHINRVFFSKIRVIFVCFQRRQGKPPTLLFSRCVPLLIYFLKRGWWSTFFFSWHCRHSEKIDFCWIRTMSWKTQLYMASSCHIGVIDSDRNRYRMWAY